MNHLLTTTAAAHVSFGPKVPDSSPTRGAGVFAEGPGFGSGSVSKGQMGRPFLIAIDDAHSKTNFANFVADMASSSTNDTCGIESSLPGPLDLDIVFVDRMFNSRCFATLVSLESRPLEI